MRRKPGSPAIPILDCWGGKAPHARGRRPAFSLAPVRKPGGNELEKEPVPRCRRPARSVGNPQHRQVKKKGHPRNARILNSGFRLTGLASYGSTPWAIGSALLTLVVIRVINLSLLDESEHENKEVDPMPTLQKVCLSCIETIWSVGTGIVAGVLPA